MCANKVGARELVVRISETNRKVRSQAPLAEVYFEKGAQGVAQRPPARGTMFADNPV